MGVQVGLLKAGSKRLRLEVTGSTPKAGSSRWKAKSYGLDAFDWLPKAGNIKLSVEAEGRRLKV